MSFTLEPIGVVQSCFSGKFGIPRQSGLASAARAVLEFYPPFDQAEAFSGLEECSHLWVEFIFHQFKVGEFRPRVRPPRLGGNRSIGVFATRAPNRPNRLGLSVVRLDQVEVRQGKARLHISGHDLLDGTPIIDIKPYVPYADALPQSHNSIAPAPPTLIPVRFSQPALEQCQNESARLGQALQPLIEQLLAQDPRPQYQQPDPERRYAMTLFDLDVAWHYWLEGESHGVEVCSVRRQTSDVRRLTSDV
ncbi:tRNA (N6-threonylcarbamoyladenosine(37)-N6)-methyltransferase TrmO [Gilvimarinus sp. DA14]|uniref:tRNA (N6-threonylcarbamoyladenosine(37)-N6)-methyltransferase TrmO n=1 Tax=Gilvimarinus sp. DA14 TaxID=2956798 RepID=UPI0020B689B8|nr:tRNA (N6-threonylcarbamoyladenosine(37)-N6)-methyltransferase TrmO [Gilvimarinus sp. DA14]UTF58753.1 tRNA (N6-threonylcarbamoyladenosine(37)-N6)-methyltransferase TrmO [Gilvimarinus sp. DA14]